MSAKKYFLLLGILFLCLGQAVYGWTGKTRLTWLSGSSQNPRTAVDSDRTLFVVWHDNTPGNKEIYFKKRILMPPLGDPLWITARRLTWTAGESTHPVVCVDNNDVIHLVWTDNTPGPSSIYYKKSTDHGNTWSVPKRLTWSIRNYGYSDIAVDSSGGVYVVFKVLSGTVGLDFYMKKSLDGGVTWLPLKRLTWNARRLGIPSLVVDGLDQIHLVWVMGDMYSREVFHKNSTDGGVTWTVVHRLTWHPDNSSPDIAVDGSGGLHVVWNNEDATGKNVYYKYSMNGGLSWTGTRKLVWSGQAVNPKIAAAGNDGLYIAWSDCKLGYYEIYFRRSQDSGSSWASIERLTWGVASSHSPHVSISDGLNIRDIHVVWSDSEPGNYEIFHKMDQEGKIKN